MKDVVRAEDNTVAATDQLVSGGEIRFFHTEGQGIRILFVGNSITLHGPRPEIGWNRSCGMAASDEAHDYVHLLAARVLAKRPDACFGICQVSEWEHGYLHGEDLLPRYERARRFGADVIVMRFAENMSHAGFTPAAFTAAYNGLLAYLDPTGHAKVLYTDSFWQHFANPTIAAIAEAAGERVIPLTDLGNDPAMKALGLFEHDGVASHPGDRGMMAIADRIWQRLEPLL